jgi:endoglycosylceramidase
LAGFWGNVSKSFVDENAIIGYELINEPFAGDVYKDPLYFIPGVAGNKNLMPMYDNLAK